jgi:hypothetical protein
MHIKLAITVRVSYIERDLLYSLIVSTLTDILDTKEKEESKYGRKQT